MHSWTKEQVNKWMQKDYYNSVFTYALVNLIICSLTPIFSCTLIIPWTNELINKRISEQLNTWVTILITLEAL
jgi:hypothetical protein